MEPRHVPDPDERLPIGAAARVAGVAVETLRRWADAGQVPFERRSTSGHRVFRRGDIEAINQPQQAAEPAAEQAS